MPALLSILFGWLFTLAAAYSLGRVVLRRTAAPGAIVLAAGAPLLSLAVFLLMLAGAAGRPAFLVLGAAAIAAGARVKRVPAEPREAPDRATRWLLGAVLSVYGVLYCVHALAPEIQPDAGTYHLGIVAESLRRGSLPPRVGFYEMLPQGLEMLFAFAFAFGAHSAAKMVHFSFLAATLPLMMALGQRFRLPPYVPGIAAALYLLTPVVGVSGTAAYNDAALVFFVLAAFWLLWSWREEGKRGYLLAGGLAAGFCYAIKTTGLMIAPLAVLLVVAGRSPAAAARKWREALTVAAGAALMIVPWMLRDLVLCGNPLAPLFNSVFPNPYFHVSSERTLAVALRSYEGVGLLRAPLELAIGSRLQGVIGPALLLTPLGLLALRKRPGRVFWAVAALLALPWAFNIGARFLMPSLPFLFLSLVLALPRPAAYACLLFQAAACWPAVVPRYAGRDVWTLRGFPWRAALRLEPEGAYLARQYPEYELARVLDANVPPGNRVFDLFGVAQAYARTRTLVYWHSAAADRMLRALTIALGQDTDPLYRLEGQWPEQRLSALRFRLAETPPALWSIHDVLVFRGEERVAANTRWLLSAWPDVWETPLAFDRNPVSCWSTWQRARRGMFLEVEFDRPAAVSRAVLVCDRAERATRVRFDGMDTDGRWHTLDADPSVGADLPRTAGNTLRLAATRLVRREGFRYILAPAAGRPQGPLGRSLANEPATWGVRKVAAWGDVYLVQIP